MEQSKEREALIADLDWSIESGMHGPRTCETLKRARAALTPPRHMVADSAEESPIGYTSKTGSGGAQKGENT